MRRRAPLPESLGDGPFPVEAALAAGLGRRRLALDDLDRPFHGIRSRGDASPVAQYAPRLRPGDRFSHTTAAALWGAPLPASVEGDVHVTAGPGLDRPQIAGAIGHRSADTTSTLRGGYPVSPPITAFLESARILGVKALVAVGDHLVLDPRHPDPDGVRPYVSQGELLSAVRRASGRGIVTARAAAALVRQGVESPRETRLRLLLLDAGLPEPICGFPLDDRGGRRIGWFDLAWPERRVIAEYDGDQHRTSTEQYDRDITRFDLASDAGWRVIRVRSSGLSETRHDTIHRVRSALRL